MVRAGLLIAVLALTILSSSCTNLVGGKDISIPRLLTPLADAKFDDLIDRLKPFTELKSLITSQAYLQFLDAEAAYRYPETYATMLLQRPDRIRLLIQSPGIKAKVSDMVSEENHFKVAVYFGEYKRFLSGTNDADYMVWREKLGDKGKSALVAARPFHFTEALMMRPLMLEDQRFTYILEETLIEEPDLRKGAKKGARALRSFYVISEIEYTGSRVAAGRTPAQVRRRFWFDRTTGLPFVRQQIFDNRGLLMTDVSYSNYQKLSADNQNAWPSIVTVSRPHDNYSARITFSDARFDVNADLQPTAFVLENSDKLPETDLDKPLP